MKLFKNNDDQDKEDKLSKARADEEKNNRLKKQLEASIRGLEHELEMIRLIKRNHTK